MRRLLIGCCAIVALACREHSAEHQSRLFSADSLARPRLGYDARGRASPMALAEVVVTGVGDLPPVTPADVAANMIIRTAEASIQVDSLEPAIARVRVLAAHVGGYVANSDVTSGKNELRSATLELKIPAERFDESLNGLSPIGKLESVSVEAQDVGEEFVDVNARMDNAHRLEQRLIGLLAARTGKLKDVLDVEQALAKVREDIERYEGRIRYLKAHAAMSTLSVTVHEPAPVVGTAGQSVMGEAFAQAWRNFVGLIALVVQSLGVIIPLGVVAFIVWTLTRRWRTAKQRAA
ncbi:MAG TPA: DUF4349 domain-containing protein [Gemmatimonadales bacterium]|nr:DUF4349 domain-containing protein [Gemmatimonadales bacterium]